MGVDMGLDGLVFYMIVAMAFVLIIVLIFLYIKDGESSRKFRIYEKAIEELNANIISQQTTVNNLSKKIVAKSEIIRLLDDEKVDTTKALEAIVEKVKALEVEIKSIELSTTKSIKEAKDTQDSLSVPPIVISSPSYNTNDKDVDEKVVSMHNEGYSNDTIAKQLKVSIGEIEFMIKREKMLNALNIKES